MNGQWKGRYSGTTSGQLVVDLDDMDTHYEGRACAYDDNDSLPSTFVIVKIPKKETAFRLHLDLYPINPRTGDPATWDQVAKMFPPGTIFPRSADINLNWTGETLNVNWLTDIGTSGAAELPKSRANEASEYQPLPEVTNWEEFKIFVCGLEHRRYVFRGQKKALRLRTGFHRTGRADLQRFLEQDIPTLYRHLSLRTSHIFDLKNPDQNGAFFNLVQHHGYPTPLLDWTYSPFVSAFFAYQHVKNSEEAVAGPDDKVRIFVFDQNQWRVDWKQLSKLTPCGPHFSILEFIPIENVRLIPQQSISSVTNIDDIETYIRSRETTEKQYLRIIELPLAERRRVMRELSIMGITAGSLFPGFDGACEELRERFFNL